MGRERDEDKWDVVGTYGSFSSKRMSLGVEDDAVSQHVCETCPF